MTLAVMTRATLGHSARPLRAGVGTIFVYGLVTLAAALRFGAPLVAGPLSLELVGAAGLAWSAAFGLFVCLYAPLLVRRQP